MKVDGDGFDPRTIPGVDKVTDFGKLQELRISQQTDTQDVLAELMRCGRVTHFELPTPSLHDIFVRIARPAPKAAYAGASRETAHA